MIETNTMKHKTRCPECKELFPEEEMLFCRRCGKTICQYCQGCCAICENSAQEFTETMDTCICIDCMKSCMCGQGSICPDCKDENASLCESCHWNHTCENCAYHCKNCDEWVCKECIPEHLAYIVGETELLLGRYPRQALSVPDVLCVRCDTEVFMRKEVKNKSTSIEEFRKRMKKIKGPRSLIKHQMDLIDEQLESNIIKARNYLMRINDPIE